MLIYKLYNNKHNMSIITPIRTKSNNVATYICDNKISEYSLN